MSGPTPGPWLAEENAARGAWIKGVTGEWVALACGDTDERAEANARLISAAPDLLEALERVTKLYVDLVNCGDCGSWDPEMETQVKEARAAVAKATGK